MWIKKAVYIFLGTLFMGLGLLGIVLPLLPTTPMLLLTAYFYAKGSKRFHVWFTHTWLYRRYLKNFAEQKAMTRRGKWKLMLIVDVMILPPFLMAPSTWMRVVIIMVVLIKYIYFFTVVKTLPAVKKTVDVV